MAELKNASILIKLKRGIGRPVKEGEKPWRCDVHKGEIVVEIPFNERSTTDHTPHNYRLYTEPNVTLYAPPTDVTPLYGAEADYLLAVHPPSVRYREHLMSENLKEKMELKVGDIVIFKWHITTDGPESYVRGKIRYLGKLREHDGVYFGIEILEEQFRGKGTTNGRPYFDCGINNAVYVAVDKILKKSQVPPKQPTTRSTNSTAISQSAGSKTPVVSTHKHPQGSSTGPASNTRSHKESWGQWLKQVFSRDVSTATGVSSDKPQQFKFGDHVILQSVNNTAIYGTVRWVGDATVRGQSVPFVGIETDKKINPDKEFPELHVVVTDSRGQELFKIKSDHSRVFVPEGLVVHVEQYIEQKKKEDEEKYEKHIADTYGLTLEEYRTQKEMLEEANQKRDKEHDNKEPVLPDPPLQTEEQYTAYTDLDETIKLVSTGRPVNEDRVEKQRKALEEFGYSSLPSISQQHYSSNVPPPINEHHFTIGSMVVIPTQSGEPLRGVIMWIGTVSGKPGLIAGVELDQPTPNCSDGTCPWDGRKYFNCLPGRGYFCPLSSVQQDTTFIDAGQIPASARQDIENPLKGKAPKFDPNDSFYTPDLFYKYIGDEHGIQGHHNSCYLDSSVFGLFALTDSFYELLLEEPVDEVGKKIKYILWKGIVNPLRNHGLVLHESVMDLRNSLEELGRMKGANTDEKDPEEFLNMLFKDILRVKPFLSIKRPFGVEKEFFVQLFFEIDQTQNHISETEKLLTQMFLQQNISFTKIPSKLLLQMPRFGKDFELYNRIIPSLTLDVKPILNRSNDQKCCFCLTEPATVCCKTCPKELFHNEDVSIPYCIDCNIYCHTDRTSHEVEEIKSNDGLVSRFSKMQLLSVICIETSHYVCYTRSGNKWLFHDSMANRLYDMYNIPRVVDVSNELQEWVYNMENRDRLMRAPAKSIPEYVRRFTQDIYMCVYINPDLQMFGDHDDSDDDDYSLFTPSINLPLCINYDNDTASQQVGINDIAPLHFTMNDLQNLIKEKSLLNEGLVPPNEEITKLQEIIEEQQKKYEQLQEATTQLEEKNKQLQQEATLLETKSVQLEATNVQLQQEKRWLSESFDSISSGYEELFDVYEKQKERSSTLVTKLNEIEARFNTLQKNHQQLQDAKEIITNEHRQLQKGYQELHKTNKEITIAYKQEEKKCQQLQDAQETMTSKHSQLENEHQLVKKKHEEVIQQKQQEYQLLQNTHSELVTSYQQKEKEYKSLEDTHGELITSYQQKEQEIVQLHQAQQQLEDNLKAKQDEVSSLQGRITATEQSWKVNYKEVTLTKQELGRGGWGVVWIGEFRCQKVAVKQIHDSIVSDHFLQLLNREINTMAQLRHPNLLQFIGAVLDHPSGNPMIITEIMDISLRGAYEKKQLSPVPVSICLSIMRDVAVGLNYLHCLPDPIIHRDVSSANVLLESKGPGKWKTKISDFGSAKLARSAVTKAPGATVYSAPEALQSVTVVNKKKQTTKMDIFSYGVLFCEAMNCQFPDEDIFQNLLKQTKTSSPSIHQLILQCISEDPEHRPTMKQVIQQLDSIK